MVKEDKFEIPTSTRDGLQYGIYFVSELYSEGIQSVFDHIEKGDDISVEYAQELLKSLWEENPSPRGAPFIDQAVLLATEIARALKYAHKRMILYGTNALESSITILGEITDACFDVFGPAPIRYTQKLVCNSDEKFLTVQYTTTKEVRMGTPSYTDFPIFSY